MESQIDVEAVTRRFKKIEGQIRGIMKMVAEGKGCEDILIQIGAAKSALHNTGLIILEGYLKDHLAGALQDDKKDEAYSGLSSAIKQFSRMS